MMFETSDGISVVASFDTMGLKEDLVKGIYAYGFEKPSAIQQRAIIPIIKGRDLIAQSQSGTGKTAVFSIGILQVLDTSTASLQALVLSPTRELAEQTQKVMLALGDYMSVKVHACIGGKSIGEDIKRLEYGVHAVSGTPGRVFDMIKRGALQTRGIKMLVLDEADEMLNRGFKEQIYDIYRWARARLLAWCCRCHGREPLASVVPDAACCWQRTREARGGFRARASSAQAPRVDTALLG